MITGSLQRGDLWASSLSPESRADYFRALKDSIPTFSLWQYIKDEVLPFFTITGSVCSTVFGLITISFGASLLMKYCRLTKAGVLATNVTTLF